MINKNEIDRISKNEIDRLIEEERRTILEQDNSIDNHNERRMTCKFFGHGKIERIDKYRQEITFYCSYCAEIVGYKKYRRNKRMSCSVIMFEYMLTSQYKNTHHPKS